MDEKLENVETKEIEDGVRCLLIFNISIYIFIYITRDMNLLNNWFVIKEALLIRSIA